MNQKSQIESFIVNLVYDNEKDTFRMTNDRPLSKGDVVLMISNLLSLLEEQERDFAIQVATSAVKSSEEARAKVQ